MRRPQIKVLNPNPDQNAAAFQPPPTGIVTIEGMKRQTIDYWKTIRVAWLAGYKINWVVPGRGGSVSGSHSVWSLDLRVSPVPEIHPARTARYSVEPYVLVSGKPHQEPTLGTRITVRTTLQGQSAPGLGVAVTQAPTGLGETARWLPSPQSYVNGVWSPQSAPPGDDSAILWRGAEANQPVLYDEFTYAKRGQWVTTSSLSLRNGTYFRLEGMPLAKTKAALPPITFFFVAGMTTPTRYWASVLKAVEPDGSTQVGTTLLDLRLMPDGNLHPFTWGWQRPLPLVGESHALSLFGFTLDSANDFLRLFTIDRTLRMAEMGLYYPHSTTANFVLGRSAEALFNMDLLDVLMYRGPLDASQIEQIASVLDASYGITAVNSQEQG